MSDTLDNTLTPIDQLIVTGLGQRFRKLFDVPLLITNLVNKTQAFAEAQAKKPDLKLPFAFASYSNFTRTEGRYAPTPLLRRGLTGGYNSDGQQSYRLRMLPVTTEFQITVLSQDINTLISFSRTWLFATIEGSMKFTVKYGIADVDIHVELDQTLSIPQRAAGVNEPEMYELQAALRVEGYFNKQLEPSQVVNSVEADTYLNDPYSGNPALVNTQVFTFKPKSTGSQT